MKQIITQRGEVKYLCEALKVSEPTVIAALRFRTNSPLAVKIRALAKERGGKETEYVN